MRNGLILLALSTTLSLGCGDSDDPGNPSECPATGTGVLELTVRGLPAATQPRITLRRGMESRVIVTGGRLEGLAAGAWTLTPEPVAGSGGLIRAAFDAPEAQVCVRDAQAAASTVDYALIPSSQKLWLSTSNGAAEVEAFAAANLGASGSPAATVLLSSNPAVPRASGLAFDARGNLWMALGSGELRRYPARDLGASGAKTPDVVLTGTALKGGTPGPIAIAFDAQGNLWATIGFSNKVIRLGSAQLTSTTTVVPEVELAGLGDPAGLAFDPSGNLWVGDSSSGRSRVHKVAAESLRASGTVTPVTSIDAKTTLPSGNSFTGPSGLAFDGEGNLWVAYSGSGIVARLTPDNQRGTGEVTLAPTVQLDVGGPRELAFDETGGLWLGYESGSIARLGPSQLAATGAPSPAVLVSSADLGLTHGVALYPAPARLPLFHRLP
ncbi:hypothetical protein NVS55_28965 [Myxococcus stipitatus]|uniref:Vgb family protein n=1 Tax=Myxococcus stipitatus TaxID=83455 RepID=UPI00314508E2